MARSLALLACLAASQLAHTIFLASRNFSILSVAFTMTRTPAMPTPSAAQVTNLKIGGTQQNDSLYAFTARSLYDFEPDSPTPITTMTLIATTHN